MKKGLLILTILLLGTVAIQAQTKEIYYFFSESCSYCKDVTQFLEENDIESKIEFEKIDINSTEGEELFNEKVAECNLSQFDAGVPMLYVDGECSVARDNVQETFISLAETDVQESTGGSLSESLNERPPIGLGLISTMILVPSILVGIAYLVVRGFKL
jgi:glutaredoxin